MIQFTQRAKDLEESPIVIFGALAAQFDDVVNLNSGSPGHGPVEEVSKAVKQVTSLEISTYKTHPYGSLSARLNASKYYLQRYGIQFDPESQINITTGFTHLFKSICETLIHPGDLVALASPVFPQYVQPIKLAGGEIVYFETEEINSWKPSPIHIKELLEQNVRMIVLNYPNNPTGATLNWEEWNQLIDFFSIEIQRRKREKKDDFIVVIDDAYVPLHHELSTEECPTYGAALQKRILDKREKGNGQIDYLNKLMQNSLIANSLSKEGMAGILCGMGASKNKKLIDALRIPGKSSVISVNTFGEIALNSVVHSSGKTLDWAGYLYRDRIKLLSNGLNTIAKKYNFGVSNAENIVSFIPTAGMYICANFSSLLNVKLRGIEINTIFDFLSRNNFPVNIFFVNGKFSSNFDIALWLLFNGVAVVPVGIPKSGYIRFSVGLPQAIKEDSTGCINRLATEEHGLKLIHKALSRIDKGFHNQLKI